ncbi:hypothetical protein [Gelidibacter japonicus]|jgi:Na+/H+-dicarboxylate symporter|uniref:hypothetical protein n=1 Tax=Gelidibacter japonicus TaxID=1962232 RepID=UPI0013D0909D|nr:hypothetical protein [Gelidibacter japonicus]MCL8008527.1 hypothetical protein [Gelidibacter japonicus]
MKIVTIILTIVALGLISFNAGELNFSNLLQGESFVAVVTIILSLCAIVLLQILRISIRIEKLSKQNQDV